MITADGASSREEEQFHNVSMEQWNQTADIVSRHLFYSLSSLRNKAGNKIASYVLNHYHANNNQQRQQQQQHNHQVVITETLAAAREKRNDAASVSSANDNGYGSASDEITASVFSTSISNVMYASSGGWPADSNAQEDLFMKMMMDSGDGFNESVSSSSSSNYSTAVAAMDSSYDNSTSSYLMPWPQRTSWIVVFAVLVIVAAVGNSLVAWIVFANKRMKTVTNYFLVNLSLADLTMSVFNCVFNFTFMLNNHWPFGGFYCTVNNFVANVTVAASVFTLVAISFDRYIAIVYPLRPRMSKSTARIAISLIWLASCILAVPCLLYSQTLSHSYRGSEVRIACIIVWPDGVPSVSQQDFIYNIVFMVSTYLFPVIVMGACYSRMGYVLWRGKNIGEQNQRQAESIQSKHKVVRMFMVIVTLFVVCWLPYHGYFVYQFIDDQIISYKYSQHIFLTFYWLAMSNTMINPLVYYYMNTRFREHFRSTLCCRKRSPSTLASTAGSAIIITRAGQRSTPILRNDRADFVTGPRQPRQGLNQRPRVITQQNGMDVIPSSHDVTYLTAMQQPNNQLMEVNHIKSPASSIENSNKKSELLLDYHQQSQQLPTLLVSSADTSSSSVGNGTAAWISSQGHLVTVWTPSGTSSLSTGRDQDNNQQQQQQQQQQHSMNLINARVHIRQNPNSSSTVDGCGEFDKISSQNVAETKT